MLPNLPVILTQQKRTLSLINKLVIDNKKMNMSIKIC